MFRYLPGRASYRRPANPEFDALLPNFSNGFRYRVISVCVSSRSVRGEALHNLFRTRTAAAEDKALSNVANILGLAPSAHEFPVVYGNVESNDKEIALQTRSINEILTDMASYITVPEAHVTKRWVRPTPEGDMGPDGLMTPLIRITSSTERPDNAFVAVPYNGYWFSIDNRDFPSKQTFTSIMFLFTFVESGSKEAAPVLTIPTTR